jgi:hypothetical protein
MRKIILTISLCVATFLANAQVVISEIHYNPTDEGAILGDDLEFIELTNIGTSPVDLLGYSFTSGITYFFGSGSLEAGASLVLAKNKTVFDSFTGKTAFGQYTGGLKNSSELIELVDLLLNPVFSVTYSDLSPWSALADGAGYSLVLANPSLPNDASSWVSSTEKGGNPGSYTSGIKAVNYPIIVNEVLANTMTTEKIELYNSSDTAVNIGYWYLSDDNKTPQKYQIPANTIIPTKSFLVFTSNDFANFFSLSSKGEEVYVFSANANNQLTGYSNGFSYSVSDAEQSFGLHKTSEEKTISFNQTSQTFGAANDVPKVGPLVITDIMYSTDVIMNEFIVIQNISNTAVSSNSPFLPDSNGIRIKAIDFKFDYMNPTSFAAGESFILTEIAPETFRTTFKLKPEVQIFQYTKVMSNNNELLQIEIPVYRDTLLDGSYDNFFKVMDEVWYFDSSPWPTEADGLGSYLKRKDYTEYASDPAQWFPVTWPILSINEKGKLNTATIYPTLAEDFILIEGFEKFDNYSILTLDGKKVKTDLIENQINIQELEAGFYVIQLQNKTQVESYTFIKK